MGIFYLSKSIRLYTILSNANTSNTNVTFEAFLYNTNYLYKIIGVSVAEFLAFWATAS